MGGYFILFSMVIFLYYIISVQVITNDKTAPACRSDDPYDTVLSVVPSTKSEKTLKSLSEEGYDDGPDPSQVW